MENTETPKILHTLIIEDSYVTLFVSGNSPSENCGRLAGYAHGEYGNKVSISLVLSDVIRSGWVEKVMILLMWNLGLDFDELPWQF